MLTSAIITFVHIHCTDNVQYRVKNKTLKPTVLPPAKAKGNIWNIWASLGLCLRQHCKLLTSDFLFKTIFKNLKKEIAINFES